MTVQDLASAVERAIRGSSQTHVERATGLSARTLRDILAGADRHYRRPTLDKLDDPLGWEPGTAWRTYRGLDDELGSAESRLVQVIAAQMDAMTQRVAMLEEAPTWAGEVLDAFRPLRPEDRVALLALARRLGSSG